MVIQNDAISDVFFMRGLITLRDVCVYVGSMISVPKDTSVASAAHFPSVCWLFAKRLHARLRRPIGLVSVTYSGSYVDEWIPSHVIDTCQVKYTDRLLYCCTAARLSLTSLALLTL